MNDTGKKFLNLMFRPGEAICVSYNKFGYHSVALSSVLAKDTVMLIPTESSCETRGMTLEQGIEKRFTDELTMVALNPISGYREDQNCTAFRNFLVEMDDGTQDEQLAYIKKMGLPYSAVTFSGNKSLHFLVSLAEDLPNEEIWRHLAEWILNVITLADDKTKNPSRSIRIPEAWREPKKKQTLVELKGSVTTQELMVFLAKHPDAMPKKTEKRQYGEAATIEDMPAWVKSALYNGVDRKKGRNQQWYSIAYEFALAGFSKDATIEVLGGYFTSERDFKQKEWLTAINSAFKNVKDK